jgi:hypothetical protein
VKIRILDDSIRLRLSQSDVQTANAGGVVESETRFPDGSVFRYALESIADGPADASFSDGRVLVRLPAEEVGAWAGDDTAVSIEASIELPGQDQLRLLVEKDFQCLTARSDEDQTDLFVNPQSSC